MRRASLLLACCLIGAGAYYFGTFNRKPKSTHAAVISNLAPNAIDCSKIGFAPGCKTFNEMVAARDRKLLSPGLVCFVTDTFDKSEEQERVFYVIKEADPNSAFRTITLTTFASGVPNDFELGVFKPKSDSFRSDESKGQAVVRAFVGGMTDGTPGDFRGTSTDEEIVLYRAYKNRNGHLTKHSMAVRRSGHFVGEYKSKFEKMDMTESGRCVKFEPAVKSVLPLQDDDVVTNSDTASGTITISNGHVFEVIRLVDGKDATGLPLEYRIPVGLLVRYSCDRSFVCSLHITPSVIAKAKLIR